MKKLFKRIAILICIMTLFTAPSTALAASTPVLSNWLYTDEYFFRTFNYEPDPYYLQGSSGTSLILRDITSSDGYWTVPAKYDFSLQVNLAQSGTFRVLIVKQGGGVVVNETVTGQTFYSTIPASLQDARYQVWVTPYSDIYVDVYMFFNSLQL